MTSQNTVRVLPIQPGSIPTSIDINLISNGVAITTIQATNGQCIIIPPLQQIDTIEFTPTSPPNVPPSPPISFNPSGSIHYVLSVTGTGQGNTLQIGTSPTSCRPGSENRNPPIIQSSLPSIIILKIKNTR